MTNSLNRDGEDKTKLLTRWDDPIIKAILDAVEDEHDDHKSCGFEIGCILTSKPLLEKLEKITQNVIQEAKAEERKRCLEVIKKEVTAPDGDDISFDFDNGFNSALDQAISAITNDKNK